MAGMKGCAGNGVIERREETRTKLKNDIFVLAHCIHASDCAYKESSLL